ncbi:hypothetical protein LTR56_016030 [Elasticomyces elasticus]|nr:hypothetical protein LTR56_016030 [Elasticomyces elasticus]KAK3642476.1 hypothetical protein LTR22_016110 [Elasticomyces elasticus]KAK5764287.1 hypothetical protein LTS12_005500 [Elasticomyces elasticus]
MLIALLACFTAANPLAKRAITPNTQSCVAKQKIPKALIYTVRIGVTYANGAGCSYIKDQLQAQFGEEFGSYTCLDDGDGNTLLKFTTYQGHGPELNDLMHSIYPMVNGFNCPSN